VADQPQLPPIKVWPTLDFRKRIRIPQQVPGQTDAFDGSGPNQPNLAKPK